MAVLGRQPEISVAELEALGFLVREVVQRGEAWLAKVEIEEMRFDPARLGGTMKLAATLTQNPLDYLAKMPEGKITFGVSDYSSRAIARTALAEALKWKRILVRHGRSVRIVDNKNNVLSSATVLHNGLAGKNERKVELVRLDGEWYRTIMVQDIDAYSRRDQARPARDAKVGMLPPKLAQILINLCGLLPEGARILDPFCGTGVVLQEAVLMGYRAYGTDLSERMVEYSEKNLAWLRLPRHPENGIFEVVRGDATKFRWEPPIDAVACESYLGVPMSQIPGEMKLKEQKQECRTIILGFLKNLAGQIAPGTPVVVAMPAWRRRSDEGEKSGFARLNILDEIQKLGYNVNNKSREGLFYCRSNQIVARDIIILRKT